MSVADVMLLEFNTPQQERQQMSKYPISVQLSGTDGNAFAIMATVKNALKKAGVEQLEIDEYIHESMSGDYDHLLQTAMKWVQVS